jgi:hypothetical protein
MPKSAAPAEAGRDIHAPQDLVGQTAGLVTVLRYAGSKAGKGALWECRCRCGTAVVAPGNLLRKAQRGGFLFGCRDCRATAKATAFRDAIMVLCEEYGYPATAIDWVETAKAVLIRVHKPVGSPPADK